MVAQPHSGVARMLESGSFEDRDRTAPVPFVHLIQIGLWAQTRGQSGRMRSLQVWKLGQGSVAVRPSTLGPTPSHSCRAIPPPPPCPSVSVFSDWLSVSAASP